MLRKTRPSPVVLTRGRLSWPRPAEAERWIREHPSALWAPLVWGRDMHGAPLGACMWSRRHCLACPWPGWKALPAWGRARRRQGRGAALTSANANMCANLSVYDAWIKPAYQSVCTVNRTDIWILLLQCHQVPYRSARPATIRRTAEVGARILSLRLWRKLSQEDLALRAGMDRRSIMGMELGRTGTTVDAAFDIADALRVPIAWLFTDDWTYPPDWADREPDAPPRPP